MPDSATPITPSAADTDAVFKALASSHRRAILEMLSACEPEEGKTCCAPEELCACKIRERLGLSTSTVSHHMSVLTAAGLVDARKDGVWTYYTLKRPALAAASDVLKRY